MIPSCKFGMKERQPGVRKRGWYENLIGDLAEINCRFFLLFCVVKKKRG